MHVLPVLVSHRIQLCCVKELENEEAEECKIKRKQNVVNVELRTWKAALNVKR